jgi:hypothetical protein
VSESEQSWSYGAVHGNMERGRLLVCAMAMLKPDARWPMDNRAFAAAVDRQTEKGNPVAAAIHIFPGVAGRHCPDFKEMLSLARSSGFIAYLAPGYTQMLLHVSSRMVHDLQRGIPERDVEAAKALVQEFWEEVHGLEGARA